MNSSSDNNPQAIRSDIETTRRRLDNTIDALGNRLHGRHLIDEVVGFCRGAADQADGEGVGQQFIRSASSASRKLVTSIEKNPVPVILIGAGVAWLAYQGMHDSSQDGQSSSGPTGGESYPEDDYGSSGQSYGSQDFNFQDGSAGSKLDAAADGLKDKASGAVDAVKNSIGHVGDQISDKATSVKRAASKALSPIADRAAQISSQTRAAYAKTRETVQRTANEKPVELGLGCLAAGLLVGLLIPTPAPVNRLAGPQVAKLRHQAQEAAEGMAEDLVEKGKHIVSAGTEAVSKEAEAQGLTPSAIAGTS